MKKPFFLGITGGAGGGKKRLATKIQDSVGAGSCLVLNTGHFYRDLTKNQLLDIDNYNFDHPSAFDFQEMKNTVQTLLNWQQVKVPQYDHLHFKRTGSELTLQPAQVMILEGIASMYDEELRNWMNLKLFIQLDSDERLAKRISVEVNERGRDTQWVLSQYLKFVKPAYEEFILPLKKYCDIIIPKGAENEAAFNVLINQIKSKLH
mmetsp:Transcript_13394/g.19558  ORF Transcript_13394/g.19558 Transcript_13394/m.19558 type:complete len:206 (+) Transcript_13394:19-636(+)